MSGSRFYNIFIYKSIANQAELLNWIFSSVPVSYGCKIEILFIEIVKSTKSKKIYNKITISIAYSWELIDGHIFI